MEITISLLAPKSASSNIPSVFPSIFNLSPEEGWDFHFICKQNNRERQEGCYQLES